MKNKLFEAISPIFFWSSMTTFVLVSIFFISINYKVVLINSAIASEPVYASVNRAFPGKEADISDEPDARSYIDCDCEKEFKKEYPVVWSGEVIATFVSGEDFGVERFNKNAKYKRFYVVGQSKYSGDPGANVKVRGRLIGITCAYANTVFGECVGEVVADQVTVLSK